MVWVLLIAAAFAPATGRASDLRVESGSYSWSGPFYYFSYGPTTSMLDRSGRGAGYYRYGYLNGKFSNWSNYTSGSVVGALWVSEYIGASSGWRIFSRNWGGNPKSVFYANQSWTSKRFGYRKRIKRYGYSSLAAHEYDGGWPIRDEMYFDGSYGKW